ncbi:MAG: hypothetical protein KME35_24340 [Aphanocapsa sp. GSE-SYN-MK-11-07L]|jgi:uncharacterized protein YoaH (UPF0181 family)|nr:hypothetical protein [Aphanocapsa sp. GSE-SYN-MK-11-07L]
MTNNTLKETAQRFGIPEEKIPEILQAMKIKDAKNFTDAQVQGFEKICSLMKGGMEMAMAVQTAQEEVRTSKTSKAAEANGSSPADGSAAAIVQKESTSLLLMDNQAAQEAIAKLPHDFQTALRGLVRQLAQKVAKEIPRSTTEDIHRYEQQLLTAIGPAAVAMLNQEVIQIVKTEEFWTYFQEYVEANVQP